MNDTHKVALKAFFISIVIFPDFSIAHDSNPWKSSDIRVSLVLRKLWRDNWTFLLAADLRRVKKQSLTQYVPTLDVTTRVPLLTEHKRALFAPPA